MNTQQKVMRILKQNLNTYLTCRNIQHLVYSKWKKMPPDGTVSAVLYKWSKKGIIERKQNIGCRNGYGYKLISQENIMPYKLPINAIMELQV